MDEFDHNVTEEYHEELRQNLQGTQAQTNLSKHL